MNRNEVKVLLEVMSMAYPQAYKNMTVDGKRKQIVFWENRFKDYPAELVMAATEYFIDHDVGGFPPTVGKIKAICFDMTAGSKEKDLFAEAMEAVRGNVKFEQLSAENKMFFGSQQVIDEYGRMNNFNPEVFRGQYDRKAKQIEERTATRDFAEKKLGNGRLVQLEKISAGIFKALPEGEKHE